MEGDRKYRQRGYNDSDRPPENGTFRRDERPRPPGPRPPIDITGPRLPRMVQAVTASRCYNCSTMLGEGTDFKGHCPKCGTALHCCKQCAHFEPSTRFQCLKPIVARVPVKDQANECELFNPRVTVARDVHHPAATVPAGNGVISGPGPIEPRNASDARAAFDSLFRKSDPDGQA